MAILIAQPAGKAKATPHSVKIDMTPMVDLGFLLITFFIFTTTLTQPGITKLNMPAQEGQMTVQEKLLLTAVLDRDNVYVFEGAFEKAFSQRRILTTGYDVKTGLGEAIRQKQKALSGEGLKDELMIALKPLPSASYQDVMNALDEMLLNNVSRYGIMEFSAAEKKYWAGNR